MKNKGFTLLEITVVISIITLLSTIFLANYRQGEKNFALQRSAHQLAQDLRRAQEMTMAGREFKGKFQGGYGIHLVKGTGEYILFIDCDDDDVFDEGNTTCDNFGTEDILIEEVSRFSLEEGITIKEILPSSPFLDIKFYPPDPSTTITPAPANDSATITLTFGGASEKKVIINTAGLIEIE